MNRRFLTAGLISACCFLFVSKSDACELPPIADINNQYTQYVCVGCAAQFDGTTSCDQDEDGNSIEIWYWNYSEDSNWYEDGAEPNHTWDEAGSYGVYLYVRDDEGVLSEDYDYCHVYVVKVNDVNEDKTIACVLETVTFTANPYPSGKPLDCIEWQKRYRPPGSETWGDWETADGGDNTTELNTGTAGYYQYRARNGSGDTWKESDEVTIYTVQTVTWETYHSNTLLDWCPKNTGSKRIFSGKQTFNDPNAADRKKVTVKATITPAVADANVYFDWWDVDDPSTDWFPLDTTGSDGRDNKGSGETLSADSNSTNASGEATVTFTVSMQPGDNFRITASASKTRLDEVTQQMIDYGSLPSGVILLRMLTTWRKLWVEQDSMGDVPETGNQKNHVAGTASRYDPYDPPPKNTTWVHLGQNLPNAFDDVDQFQYGRYVAGTKTYVTRKSTAYTSAEDEVKVSGDPNGDGVPMVYKLYDDDETTLPSYPGLGSWSSVYEDAYIKLYYLPESYHDEVTFYRNLHSVDVSLGLGDWNNSYDCPSQSNFWTTLVVSLFQPQTSKDFDPIEPYICGQTVLIGNESGIYLETIRDAQKSVGKMIAHEIGHAGGVVGHWCLEACLMKEDANGNFGEDFCNDCLLEFREDSDW